MTPTYKILEEIYLFRDSFYTSTSLMTVHPRRAVQNANFCLTREGVVEHISHRGYRVVDAGKLKKFINNIPLFMLRMQEHYAKRSSVNKLKKKRVI
ncbi:MAG: hypothetical protein U9P49_05850 [Thermodesulfobacteriota bacterium]|nr:hypothetical protein [Thermodesulfobacteriota bacterium]